MTRLFAAFWATYALVGPGFMVLITNVNNFFVDWFATVILAATHGPAEAEAVQQHHGGRGRGAGSGAARRRGDLGLLGQG